MANNRVFMTDKIENILVCADRYDVYILRTQIHQSKAVTVTEKLAAH
jgi:hypothetical protein